MSGQCYRDITFDMVDRDSYRISVVVVVIVVVAVVWGGGGRSGL